MSQQTGVLDITLKAGADLRNYQYRIVYMSAADTVTFATTATAVSIGILQNDPDTGEAAVVRVLGTSKIKMEDAESRGAMITASATGMGVSADADKNWVIGTLLEAAAAGDIAELLISRFKASI